MDINYDELNLDPGVIHMVKYFNQQNLPTIMSCEGHNDTNQSMFWIEFDPSVTEEDIISFQRNHTRDFFGFCSNGWFTQFFYLDKSDGPEVTIRTYRYMAATKKAAYQDLSRWLEEDYMRLVSDVIKNNPEV